MPWSKQQQLAINTQDKNILVAAAAGSGKTSVLVERVIEKIVNGICDINQILVVTFTNAAASEMRERIALAITEKLPDKKKERQLALLNIASISTLHAFCQKIIRQNFHQLGLDPKFRLANQQEIDLLKLDVLEELFEQKYDLADNEDFISFTDTYGNERGDENIYDIILKLYEYAQSQPFPQKWLSSLPEYFNLPEKSLDNCPWLKIIQSDIADNLNLNLINAQKMKEQAIELNLPNYEKNADEIIVFIQDLIDNQNSWQNLYVKFNELKFSRMVAPRKTAEEIKNIFKNLRDGIKKSLNTIKENYFAQSPEEVLEDFPILKKQANTLCNITLDFANHFARAKAEKAIIDFNDLEHFTLDILASENSTTDKLLPTQTAIALQNKYQEIMVDEYQDTNGVQEAILKLIASPTKPNLFLVGDVKQSIYKFRLAEPELFLEKYTTYPDDENCTRIDLSQNFRSRKEILDGVNFIFSQIMTLKSANLPYGKAEALYCGFPYPENPNSLKSPIELILIPKENSDLNMQSTDSEDEENLQGFVGEANYIADRLHKLMHNAPLVFDKHTKVYRQLKWRDIVILLRSVQNKAQILAQTLRQANIPVYASIETGYFQETEVRIMISLLKIIDNPQQDIPLASVLYSPIVGLTAEDLARIRLLKQDGNLYQALQKADEETEEKSKKLKHSLRQKIHAFLNNLNAWRNYAKGHSVPELIWLLLNETGYYDYVGGMPEGLVRQANLRALYDRASSYEETSFRGLFRFLRFIGKMQKTGNDLAVARSLGENEDVVRIMSIHKSKGLEFPVVILADTGKQFNLKDTQNPVLFHKKLGLGLYVNDVKNHIRYHTLSRQAIIRQIISEYKAEEMRVLYVAMTRAREKLIITGSIPNMDKFAKRFSSVANEKSPTLPDYLISNGKSYLDWLAMSLFRHADGKILRQHSKVESATILKDNSSWQLDLVNTISKTELTTEDDNSKILLATVQKFKPLPKTQYAQLVESYLNWQYPHQNALTIPTKLSVTEIKRRNESEIYNLDYAKINLDDESTILDLDNTNRSGLKLTEDSFKRPQFIQQKSAITATEYGSLMHTVMQHIDFHDDLSDSNIKKQLEDLSAKEIIAKEHLNKIYRKNIREFFYSDIGQRLKKSAYVERELAFNRMIPAKTPLLHYENATDSDSIFIQGIIDLIFEEADGLVLIDYKTDRCEEDIAKEKYKIQIQLYAESAEQILRKKVKEKYLYLFHKAKFIKM